MPSPSPSPVVPLPSRRRLELRHAYAAVLPEMLRLEEGELLPVNRDVSGVVTSVLGAALRLRGFRERMRALPEFDLERVERLEVYARALAQAQALYATAGAASDELPDLVRQARELKGMLLSDARALAGRGLIDIEKLEAPRGRPSHRGLAFGLLAVAGLIRRHFEVIQRRSAVTLADLDRAEGVAEKLLGAVARRGRAPSRAEEAREMLRRAFTLCVGAYAEARRGLVFLCGCQADADSIAPSLFMRRARVPRPGRGESGNAVRGRSIFRNQVSGESTRWRAAQSAPHSASTENTIQEKIIMTDSFIIPEPSPRSQEPEPRFRLAYERRLAEVREVPNEALLPINIDIPSAVTTALGSMPEISSMRSEVAARLPDFDITLFDKLEDYARAAGHAHGIHLSATAPAGSVPAMAERATSVRQVLFTDAQALAQRGLIEAGSLSNLKGPVGYKNVAFDVFALAALIRKHWGSLEGKTAVTLAELDRAEALADQLVTALGLRQEGPQVIEGASQIRNQAFTLFVKSYDQVRRAIHYLRWEQGDAEDIAPSLYAGRRRRTTGESVESDLPAPVAPPADSSTSTSTSTSVPGTPAGPPAAAAPLASAAPTAPVAPGLPGGSPFTQ